MNTRSGSFRLLLAALGAALLAGAAYLWKSSKPTPPAYDEARVAFGSLETTVLSTGVVKPENRVEVKPPIAGRAEAVLAKEGDKVRRGQILVWMSSTERAALLDAARARGPEELRKWEELYRPTPILAPVGGTVIQRQIEPGQTFAVTDPILTMSDRLIVEAQVDETDLARIHAGQKARILLDAYPESPIAASVGTIAYEATTVNNVTTYTARVIPETVPDFMRSGMTANVTFTVASRENVLLAPADAVKVENGAFVATRRNPASGAPETVPIGVGLSDGKRTEITSGLGESDVLLIPQAAEAADERPQGTNPFAPPRRTRNR